MKGKFRVTFNAPVILVFVVLCFGATLAGTLTGGSSTRLLFMTRRGSLADPMMYLRLFTHVIGHSGWAHFIGNASYLLLLGPMLEEKHGAGKMIQVIVITAVLTGIVNNLIFPNVGLCGASGVVFALIVMASFTGFQKGELPLSSILVIVIFLGQQVYDAVAVTDNIANSAHIVGGVIGAWMGYRQNKKAGSAV